ncbi:phosphotransferase [Bacillus sp. 2205SS5-2]
MQIFASFPPKKRLLHMDICKEYLILRDGKIQTVFDWTNSMIGDSLF